MVRGHLDGSERERVLIPFELEHAEQAASLHCEVLTGLITRLGCRVARAVYEGYAASERCRGIVSWSDGCIRGFAVGSDAPALLRREAMDHRRWPIVMGTAARVALRPWLLPSLMGAVRGPRGASFDHEGPELIYFAVSPTAAGTGEGSGLLEAFNETMRALGVSAYELSVDSDNSTARRFYQRRGFERVSSYRQFGIEHHRYRLRL